MVNYYLKEAKRSAAEASASGSKLPQEKRCKGEEDLKRNEGVSVCKVGGNKREEDKENEEVCVCVCDIARAHVYLPNLITSNPF